MMQKLLTSDCRELVCTREECLGLSSTVTETGPASHKYKLSSAVAVTNVNNDGWLAVYGRCSVRVPRDYADNISPRPLEKYTRPHTELSAGKWIEAKSRSVSVKAYETLVSMTVTE